MRVRESSAPSRCRSQPSWAGRASRSPGRRTSARARSSCSRSTSRSVCSPSRFVALAAGVLVAAAFAWRRRALLLVALAAGAFVVAALASPNLLHHSGGLNRITSGRSKLVGNGIKLAVHHPVIGVGIGGFKHAYGKQQHLRSKEAKSAASHDTPIT